MSKRRLSDRQKDRIQSIQERRRQRAINSNAVAVEEIENLNNLGPEILGTVVTNFGAQVDVEAVETEIQGRVVRCHMRANLENLVTGDKVIWRLSLIHISEPTRRTPISYAVFCLKKSRRGGLWWC